MLIFDIETNGLLDKLSTIHCLHILNRETGERLRFTNQPQLAARPPDGTIADGVALLTEASVLVGHNIINFDIPAIQKLYPQFAPKGEIRDTLVYSRVIWTDLKDIDFKAIRRRKRPKAFTDANLVGRHSLEAWGYRLQKMKDDYGSLMYAEGKAAGLAGEDLDNFVWGTFSPSMDDYCAQDCEVTLAFLELIESKGYSPEALDLEVRVAGIIDLQEKHGVLFDAPAAEVLAAEMMATQAELDRDLRAAFKPWYGPVIKKGRIETRDPTRRVPYNLRQADGTTLRVYGEPGAPYSLAQLIEFEPSSRDKIADRLKTIYGWEPQEFTDGGKPKVDETTLDALPYPEVQMLKTYLAISKKIGNLATGDKAFLRKIGSDGRIHGRVNSNGAVTGRMTHFDPNMNVPKVKVDEDGNILHGLIGGYGYELRGLFTVPPGYLLVGVDAEGLELRMLGHYMARYDGGAYIEAVVNGDKKLGTDVHTINRKIVGLRTRDGAKTWMYAYLYGAGDWKLGFTFFEDMDDAWRLRFNTKNPTAAERDAALTRLGRKGRRQIEQGLPALGKLQEQVKERAATGFLRGLDGRKIRVRGMHSALNSLLQGAGAIVMKRALVLAYDAFLERGWQWGRDFAFVLNVHDEFQIEAKEDLAQEIGSIAADAIRRAGEAFNLRCPLAGSQDVGKRWSDTH